MQTAFDTLVALGPDGIQLTPGCQPTPRFATAVSRARLPYSTHHGFSWSARKRPVWEQGRCLVNATSVHPPRSFEGWERWLERFEGPALETMYPGYVLGTGEQIERAMALGVPLAVDVSHLWIQRCAGVLGPATWARLQAYPHVVEVHLSANDGRADQHRPIQSDTFGLDWARQRREPTIVECYLHRLDDGARRRQLDLARAA